MEQQKRSIWKWIFFGLEMIATILSLSYYFYLTITGEGLPQTYTWLTIVLLQGTVAIIVARHEGGLEAWGIGIGASLCFLLFVTSIAIGGYNQISEVDGVVLAAILIAIVIWWRMKDDFIAVILMSIIDASGYYFTYKKVYYNEGPENLWVWIGITLSCFFCMLAADKYNKENVTYPAVTTVTGTIMCILIWYMNQP